MRTEPLLRHIEVEHAINLDRTGLEHRSADWIMGFHGGLHRECVQPMDGHDDRLVDAVFPPSPTFGEGTA